MCIRQCLAVVGAAVLFAIAPTSSRSQPTDNPDDADWAGQFGAPGMGLGGSTAYVANDLLYLRFSGGFSSALYAAWNGMTWAVGDAPAVFLQKEGATELLVIGPDVLLSGQFHEHQRDCRGKYCTLGRR